MRFRKTLVCTACFLFLTAVLSGCSSIIATGKQSFAGIYDNDEKIAAVYNSYMYSNRLGSCDGPALELSCTLTGMDTLWKMKAEEDGEVTFTGTLAVTSGKAKLVMIAPDGSLTTLLEVTEAAEQGDQIEYTVAVREGTNRLKLVAAEDTTLQLSLTCEDGTFAEPE